MLPDKDSYDNSAFAAFKVLDDFGYRSPMANPHVTIFWLGRQKDLKSRFEEASDELLDAFIEAVEEYEAVEATVTGIEKFGSEGKECAVLTLKSEKLNRINLHIASALKEKGFDTASKFAYSPHITLGYLEEGEELPEFKGEVDIKLTIAWVSVADEDIEFDLSDPITHEDDEEDEKVVLRQSQNPNARKLRKYWTTGEGGVRKIRWRTGGDWTRCVKHLRKYLAGTSYDPKRVCANYHYQMNGFWPGDKRNKGYSEEELLSSETMLYAQSLLQLDVSGIKELFKEPESKEYSMTVQTKSAALVAGITETSEDGVVEALVSVTGIIDNVNDIIEPGAYEKTLAKRTPKGVWSHDWNSPVSKVVDIKELMPGDPKLPATIADGSPWPAEAGALWVKVQFNLKTAAGRDAYENVIFYGDQAEWSIGYSVPNGAARTEKSAQSPTGKVRKIKTLDLFEFSPVLFGAASNARSLVSSFKSLFATDEDFYKAVKDFADDEIEEKSEAGSEVVDEVADETSEEDNSEVEASPSSEASSQEEVTVEEEKSIVTSSDSEDPEVQVAEVTEAIEAVEDIRDAAKSVQLNAVVIEKLKTLQNEISAILTEALRPTANTAKADVDLTETKSMREALDALIAGSADSGVLDHIDNGIKALESSIKTMDSQTIRDNANAVLDEITFAMENADEQTVSDLKALAAAIGAALQETEKANGVSQEVVAPLHSVDVDPEAKSYKVVSADEWAEFTNLV